MALLDSAMGEGKGNEGEKQEGGEAGVKRGKRNNKGKKMRKRIFFFFFTFFFCLYVVMDFAGTGLTWVVWRACMFNDRVCRRAKALCVPANVSTSLKCSCAHLKKKKKKKRGEKKLIKNA